MVVPSVSLKTGRSQLLMEVHNRSGVDARKLTLQITNTTPNLHCATLRHDSHRILERYRSLSIQIPIECEHAGEYRMEGRVTAMDLEGNQAT